jgi:hypothetical protein
MAGMGRCIYLQESAWDAGKIAVNEIRDDE